jgi:hypothetical protein
VSDKIDEPFRSAVVMVSLVLTSCSLVGGYQLFGGTFHLHLQGRTGRPRVPTSLHTVTAEETTVDRRENLRLLTSL